MRDFLIRKFTGPFLVLAGLLGIIFTVKYDALVHRTFNMGINAWLGVLICCVFVFLGIIHISSWDEF